MDLNAFFKSQVDDLKANQLNWSPKTLGSMSANRATFDNKEVVALCTNNYLGLSSHKKLIRASVDAAKHFGAGSGSVRAIAGTMQLHRDLEARIAGFKHTDAALYYQSGFTVNSGLLPAILQEGWTVISDELNHGSIIDGVRLSKAEKMIYRHNDVDDLEARLREARAKNPKGILVATDGVFSMDGDIAPLDRIAELASQFDANVYVDDAHGDGVLGENGTGIVSHFGLHGKIDIEMGTFSKAFGTVGGYVCGSSDLCEFALNKSRTWLLTGSHPPATVAASIAALDVIESEPKWVKALWRNRKAFVRGLQGLGFNTGNSQTPIVPAMMPEAGVAKEFSRALYDEGVYALPIVFPMVAKDKPRIRCQVNARHSKEDLELALSAFERVGKRLRVI